MNAAIIVGEHYTIDGSMVVTVEAADEHEVVYRALNDQDAIDLGWGPTSYGTYEASSTPAEFARDAVMSAVAPEDDRTDGEAPQSRTFGYNVVTVHPDGRHSGPRLTNAVTREEALAELDELAPFMVDGYKTVLVELREVTR